MLFKHKVHFGHQVLCFDDHEAVFHGGHLVDNGYEPVIVLLEVFEILFFNKDMQELQDLFEVIL